MAETRESNSVFVDVLNSLRKAQRHIIFFLKIQGAILTTAKQTRLSAEKKSKAKWLQLLLQPSLSFPNLKSREAQESCFFHCEI